MTEKTWETLKKVSADLAGVIIAYQVTLAILGVILIVDKWKELSPINIALYVIVWSTLELAAIALAGLLKRLNSVHRCQHDKAIKNARCLKVATNHYTESQEWYCKEHTPNDS